MNGEITKLYHEDNLYILGKWFKKERKRKDYSTRGLSRAANITPSLISDIENQKIRPNLETLKQMYEQLAIPLVTDENHLAMVNENIQSLYQAIYDQNISTFEDLFEGLKVNIKPLSYSLITVDILIMEALIPILIPEYPVPDAFFSLKNHLSYLSVMQKERFFIAMGYQSILKHQYQEAIDYLKQGINLHREKRGFAVSHEWIALCYSRLFNPMKAIEYAKAASKMHARWSNITRKITTDFMQIKSHIELNQLDTAALLMRNLSYVLVDSNQKQWFELKSFEAYLEYRKGNYKETLASLDHIPYHHFYLNILKLNASIKLGDLALAKTYYESITQDEKDPLKKAVYEGFYQVSHSPSKKVESIFDFIISHLGEMEELDLIREISAAALQYFMQQGDLHRLKDWLNIQQKLMKFEKI